MGLHLARVIRYYPESNTADIRRAEDGWPSAKVAVACAHASTNTGLHCVDPPTPASNAAPNPEDRQVIAIVAYHAAGAPIILGFLPPAVRETLFADGRYMNRLGSDVYASVTDAGDIELAHPSGTFLRIAEDPEHEDLTGRDFNSRWAIRRNQARRPWLVLSVGNQGGQQARLSIDPNGAIAVISEGGVVVDAPQAAFTRDVIIGGSLFVSGDIQSAQDVFDNAGSIAQVRLAHIGHAHGITGGNTTPPLSSSPPPSTPRRTSAQVEQQQAGEDTYTPPNSNTVAPTDFVPITLPDYFKGRDVTYATEYTPDILVAAQGLLSKVNALLMQAGINATCSSGWRPPSYNATVPGASPNSLHITGHAIDLADADRSIQFWISTHPAALRQYGLYMEAPSATPTWVHLQDLPPTSGARVFYP